MIAKFIDVYLQKPLDVNKLLNSVKRLLHTGEKGKRAKEARRGSACYFLQSRPGDKKRGALQDAGQGGFRGYAFCFFNHLGHEPIEQ